MYRYSPAFVVLHWLSAGLTLLLLGVGDVMPRQAHILLGAFVGLMFLSRLVIKFRTAKSATINVSANSNDRLAATAHKIIYGLMFVIVASGIGSTVTPSSQVTSGIDGIPLITAIHALSTDALYWVVCLHVIAALFHQFVLKDKLFSRMSFGKTPSPISGSRP